MFLFKKKYLLLYVFFVLAVSVSTIAYMNGPSKLEEPIHQVVNLSANSLTFREPDKLDAFAELLAFQPELSLGK